MIEIPADELKCGEYITAVIDKALALARKHDEDVRFVFNGVEVVVTKHDTSEAVYTTWAVEMLRTSEYFS